MLPVSIVILSNNRLSEISRNLPRLLGELQGENEFQIIVVDNNSTDGTREFLVEAGSRHPSMTLVLNDKNLGVGGGRNAGFAKANRQFIVALDDDSAIAAADLRRVPRFFHELPDVGILAFRVVHPVSGELQNPHGDHACPVANHHGAGFAFRRELYQKLGGIDLECDYGADELDFAIRVHAAGARIRYTPEITVFHNSWPRSAGIEVWRLERWIFNHVRVFYTYFPVGMAGAHSYRFLIPYLWHYCRQAGFANFHRALRAAAKGRAVGLHAHQAIPTDTARYYADVCLRPEVGNVPLLRKFWTRSFRSGQSHAAESKQHPPASAQLFDDGGSQEKRGMTDASIVILSNNRLSEISRNLPRLLGELQGENEFQIIVVDNNSTDGTREFLVEAGSRHPSMTLVLNDKNLGVGGGRNAGFAKANRQFIVALDDDTTIAAADLRRVPRFFHDLPDVGILAFRVVHPVSGELQNPHGDHACPVANHHGAGFAFRRELYQKLGGIGLECDYGAEELDFAVRTHAAGARIRYTPEITVLHNSTPRDSAEEGRRLERRVYNNVRVYFRYFPTLMATAHSFRYVLPTLWVWGRMFGVARIGRPLMAAARARAAGLRNRHPVPRATALYYADEHLRPELGNVPLLKKVWRKWRRAAQGSAPKA